MSDMCHPGGVGAQERFRFQFSYATTSICVKQKVHIPQGILKDVVGMQKFLLNKALLYPRRPFWTFSREHSDRFTHTLSHTSEAVALAGPQPVHREPLAASRCLAHWGTSTRTKTRGSNLKSGCRGNLLCHRSQLAGAQCRGGVPMSAVMLT